MEIVQRNEQTMLVHRNGHGQRTLTDEEHAAILRTLDDGTAVRLIEFGGRTPRKYANAVRQLFASKGLLPHYRLSRDGLWVLFWLERRKNIP